MTREFRQAFLLAGLAFVLPGPQGVPSPDLNRGACLEVIACSIQPAKIQPNLTEQDGSFYRHIQRTSNFPSIFHGSCATISVGFIDLMPCYVTAWRLPAGSHRYLIFCTLLNLRLYSTFFF